MVESSRNDEEIRDFIINKILFLFTQGVRQKITINSETDPTSLCYIYKSRLYIMTPQEMMELLTRVYWTGIEDERSDHGHIKVENPVGLREAKRRIQLEEKRKPKKESDYHQADAYGYLMPDLAKQLKPKRGGKRAK